MRSGQSVSSQKWSKFCLSNTICHIFIWLMIVAVILYPDGWNAVRMGQDKGTRSTKRSMELLSLLLNTRLPTQIASLLKTWRIAQTSDGIFVRSIDAGIITVRFTYRGGVIRILWCRLLAERQGDL